MNDTKQLLCSILDVGEIMLTSGAEVSRVENTIQHMAKAYGYTKTDVFTITFSIVVTVHEPGGDIETQTRRIMFFETNMQKLERCNALSRQVCKEALPLEMLQKEIADIRQEKLYPGWLIFLFYGIISAVFSIFFGGTLGDAVTALLGGFVLRLVLLGALRLQIQNMVRIILCSASASLVAVVLVKMGLGESVDKIVIGNIMLLIPGLALTTSLRDMISGDLISGLLGLCEAITRALAISVGFALVLWQFGGGL